MSIQENKGGWQKRGSISSVPDRSLIRNQLQRIEMGIQGVQNQKISSDISDYNRIRFSKIIIGGLRACIKAIFKVRKKL
jgi:hypothetical protein